MPPVISYSMGLREALPGKCRGVEVPWRGCALAVEKLKWLQRVAAVWVEALSKRVVMILLWAIIM